ncbi:YgiT-type zinc finger protein [Pseudoduganella sp. LjRoot289]|uniref:YgiT-type zinc finger protein n=1 Tax=Pseudoduganella sp. LjRoot289 TaxID=3342314 RepID=UPI003F4FEB30
MPRSSSSSNPAPADSTSSPPTSIDAICASCGKPGVQIQRVTRSYGRGDELMVIEDIPMCRCPHCHERYFTAQILHEIERIKSHRQTLAEARMVPVANFPVEFPLID